MFRGRTQAGREIVLGLQTSDATSPALPDACPLMDVYSGTRHVVSKQIPIFDKETKYFQYPLFLGSVFTAGTCLVTYRWTVGSYEGYAEDTFEIVPGGNTDGQLISMFFYRKPQGDYLVRQLTAGVIKRGRGPKI